MNRHRSIGGLETQAPKENKGAANRNHKIWRNLLTAMQQLNICNSHESKPREDTVSILIIIVSIQKEISDNISKLSKEVSGRHARTRNVSLPARNTY
jgi:hypothetical protein